MRNYYIDKEYSKGQSLVEVALVLPLILIMVAGLVEVSQLLITSNRVNTAANVAARFGANGGQDESMVTVALASVTQTLPVDTSKWDVWVIRGKINAEGTQVVPEETYVEHQYGDMNTLRFSAIDEGELEQEVFNDLLQILNEDRTDFQTDAAPERIGNTQFVGTLILYDADSILGLDGVLPFLQDRFTVRGLNVMRTYPSHPSTNGCDAFPIAVDIRNNRSVVETGTGNNVYPSSFEHPNPGPEYSDFLPDHKPNVDLENAQPGYIYKIWQGTGSGNFGWLSWNDDLNNGGPDLAESLAWPGTSTNYWDTPNGASNNPDAYWRQAGFDHAVYGYIDPDEPTDTALHIDDRISVVTGVNLGQSKGELQDHIDQGRILRVIVYDADDPANGGSGNNVRYKVLRFALMRLHGYNLPPGQGQFILAEFVAWDDSCGQNNQLPGS